jgi:pilus assembly protein CpaE
LALKVAAVGSQDNGELEALLRECGATPTMMTLGQFATLAQPSAPQPDAVVLDLRMQEGVPAGLAAFTRQHGSTGVVIIAKTLDSALMLAAMRAGANEIVAAPLTLAELDAAITRVVMMRRPKAGAGQSFALIGVKGGVGATALAVNVATALARAGNANTLLVDLHISRGDAALYLGVEPRFSVLDALDNTHKLDEAFFRGLVTRAQTRLDLLAAPDTVGANRLDAVRVRSLLEFTSKQFEFTVVDVPRTEPGAMDALDGMKSIVVVTTQELPAVRSAAVMANRLRQRYGKDRVLVVMSRLDRQSDISREDVEKVLGAPVAHVFPSDYRLTMQSLNTGRPVVLDNHSRLATSFEKFALSLAGLKASKNDDEKHSAQESGGWLTRLTGRN